MLKGMSNHLEEELICFDLLCVRLSEGTFIDFLVLSSYELCEARCSCFLHSMDMGLGFERLSDLALDDRAWRVQRQDTKPDPYDQSLCLHNSGRLLLLCTCDVVHVSGAPWN